MPRIRISVTSDRYGDDIWNGYEVNATSEEHAGWFCEPTPTTSNPRPDGHGYVSFYWPKNDAEIIEPEESAMTTDTTPMPATATTWVPLAIGDRVRITDCSPTSFIGYTGIVDDVTNYSRDERSAGRVILDLGQAPIAGYEQCFPGGGTGTVFVNAMVPFQPSPPKPGDIVRIEYTYGADDPYPSYDGKLARLISHRGESYRVQILGQTREVSVSSILPANVYAEMIDLQAQAKSSEEAVKAAVAAVALEHEAWKKEASIAAMRVAIDNNMCREAEKAMRAAGLPVAVEAAVMITLNLPMPIREYVKARDGDSDGCTCGDEGCSSGGSSEVIERVANSLAEVTNVPAFKWQEMITHAAMALVPGAEEPVVDIADNRDDDDDDSDF